MRRAGLMMLVVPAVSCVAVSVEAVEKPLAAKAARTCVTGWDVNRPDPFPGLGKFIGWAGGLERMPDGELLLVHSAGYWHVSFATPRQIEPSRYQSWGAKDWPKAPTGGRTMATRSRDGGQTWTKPKTIFDYGLDDGPVTVFVCRDKTVLCFVNVQASWYGYDEAPAQFKKDIDGLNTKQCVLRSSDAGRTWGKPIWIKSPGSFYERSHGQAIQLADGGILWPTYFVNRGDPRLYGAVHRSDDSGKTWRTISTIRRKGKNVDEPAIAKLPDDRLIMVTRPDGGVLYSKDGGVTWTDSGRTIVKKGKFKAPRLFVLRDGTIVCVATWRNLRVFLSTDGGATWSRDIPLDTSCYGYPGGFKMSDESIMVSYCQSGGAPNRVYVIRFKVNAARDGIELLPIGKRP